MICGCVTFYCVCTTTATAYRTIFGIIAVKLANWWCIVGFSDATMSARLSVIQWCLCQWLGTMKCSIAGF